MTRLSNDRIEELIEEQKDSLLLEFLDTAQGEIEFKKWFDGLPSSELEKLAYMALDTNKNFRETFKNWAWDRFRNAEDDKEGD